MGRRASGVKKEVFRGERASEYIRGSILMRRPGCIIIGTGIMILKRGVIYWSADPIGLRGGINLFLYTSNNPANYIDPYGLFLDSTGQYTGASTAAGETAIVLETVGVGSTLGTAVLYTGGGVAAFGFGYFGNSVFIEDTWLDGGIGDYLYDLLHDFPTNDPCGGRKEYQPKKSGRKKQGREPGEKKRQKPG